MVVNINNYVGGKLHGKRYGDGKAIYSDGSTYDGEWLNGKRHWEGTYTYSSGGVYNGEGTMAGDTDTAGWSVATVTFLKCPACRTGNRYEGAFVYGEKSGRGIQTFTFDGEWDQDQYRSGVLLFTNGDSYNGRFQNGKNDGQDEAVCGSDAEYTDTATGLVSTGHEAVQLAREYGAAAFLPPLRKQPRHMNELDAEAVDNACAGGKQKKCKTTGSSAAATEVGVTVGGDGNNTVGAEKDAQSCIYAYTVPTDGGSSDGKTLYRLGAHDTCDPIDHLETTADASKGYVLGLVIPCVQGKQQQLLKLMRNMLIGLGRKVRTGTEEKFLTSADELMRAYITCNGEQVNL
eukprot:8495-Heterococcus_DN1.PRE.7